MLLFCSKVFLGLFFCVPLSTDKPVELEGWVKGWGRFIDPDKDCKFQEDAGKVTIAVPGKAHDLSAELNRMNAPRIMQDVEGDFIVQVKVGGTFQPGISLIEGRTPFNGAGLLLMKDDKCYLRIERAKILDLVTGAPLVYCLFEARDGGEMVRSPEGGGFGLKEEKDLWVRLERHGDKLLGAISPDGERWAYLPVKTLTLPKKVRIGVAACNSSNKPFEPQFSEFRLFRANAGEGKE